MECSVLRWVAAGLDIVLLVVLRKTRVSQHEGSVVLYWWNEFVIPIYDC